MPYVIAGAHPDTDVLREQEDGTRTSANMAGILDREVFLLAAFLSPEAVFPRLFGSIRPRDLPCTWIQGLVFVV